MFDFDELLIHCCTCLKSLEADPDAVRSDELDPQSGLTVAMMMQEVILDSSKFELDIYNQIAICRTCYEKLKDTRLFRSQCTEVGQFYGALLKAKDLKNEETFLQLLRDDTSFNLRSHLLRLGLISSEDIDPKTFLAGIGFISSDYTIDQLDDKEIKYSNEESFERLATELDDQKINYSKKESADQLVEESDELEFRSQKVETVYEDDQTESSDEETLAEIQRKSQPEDKPQSVICPVPDCQESFSGKKYADHLKEFHRYGCVQCGLILTSKYTIGKHTTIHVQQSSSVKCTFCERMFISLAKMRAHARDFHMLHATNYKCEECDTTFEKRKLLNAHRESHLAKDCSFCKSKFDHSNKLLYHMKNMHPEKLFNCSRCKRQFLTQALRDRHVAEHLEMPPEDGYELLTLKSISVSVCSQCEKQFTSKAHLTAHQISHDPASRPKVVIRKRSKEELAKMEKKFKCEICDRRYRLPTSLEGHMKSHSATPFVCDICGASFQVRNNLKQHVTYRHSKNFRYFCKSCPKAFATSSDLLRHSRVHTNERPYKCDQCEARFKTNDGYRKHIRSHAGVKIYRCDLCDKGFMCNSSLKTHKISHTNQKAFQCFYCDQFFNVPRNRKRHIQRSHPGLPTNQEKIENTEGMS